MKNTTKNTVKNIGNFAETVQKILGSLIVTILGLSLSIGIAGSNIVEKSGFLIATLVAIGVDGTFRLLDAVHRDTGNLYPYAWPVLGSGVWILFAIVGIPLGVSWGTAFATTYWAVCLAKIGLRSVHNTIHDTI